MRLPKPLPLPSQLQQQHGGGLQREGLAKRKPRQPNHPVTAATSPPCGDERDRTHPMQTQSLRLQLQTPPQQVHYPSGLRVDHTC